MFQISNVLLLQFYNGLLLVHFYLISNFKFLSILPFFEFVLMSGPHSVEWRNNHRQIGDGVPKLCEVIRILKKKRYKHFLGLKLSR